MHRLAGSGFFRALLFASLFLALACGGARSTTDGGTPAKATVPGAPTDVQAVPGNAAAQVSWTAPVGNGGSAILSYTVTSSPGGLTTTVNSSPASVAGLSNGTSYTFTVVATNAVGTGLPSAASTAVTPVTVPDVPMDVQVSIDQSQVTVSWTAPVTNGGSAVTGYVVIPSEGGVAGTPVTVPSPATQTVFTGLEQDIPVTFTVEAINGAGSSSASSPSAPVTPVGPAVAGNSNLTVSAPVVADGVARETLMLTAKDSGGLAVPGSAVSFACATASPASGAGTTDASGHASLQISSTVAATAACTAQLPSGDVLSVQVSFNAGPIDWGQSALLSAPSSATVPADGWTLIRAVLSARDAFGNPVANLPVHWSVSGTENAFWPQAESTNENGFSTVTLKSRSAEVKTVKVAGDSGSKQIAVTFTSTPWQDANGSLAGGGVRALAVGPRSGNVYVGTSRGLELSTDHGVTFTHPVAPDNLEVISISVTRTTASETVYVLGRHDSVPYLFVSDDAGESWRLTTGSLGSSTNALFVAQGQPASIASWDGYLTVALSNDAGGSWQLRTLPFYPSVLARSAANPGTFYMVDGSGKVARSTDSASTWNVTTTVSACSPASLVTDQSAVPEKLILACAGYGQGLYTSSDSGMTFSQTGTSPNAGFITTFAVDSQSPSVFYASAQANVFRSADRGATWSLNRAGNFNGGGASYLAVDPSSSEYVYAGLTSLVGGANPIGFLRSADSGSSFSASNSGRRDFSGALLARDVSTGTLVSLVDAAYRSADFGLTWNRLPTAGLDSAALPFALVAHPADGALYTFEMYGTIRVLPAGASSWTTRTGAPIYGATFVAAAPPTAGKLFLASYYDGTLSMTTDAAATWTTKSVPNLAHVTGLTVLASGAVLVSGYDASYQSRFLRSLDDGTSWTDFSNLLDHAGPSFSYDLASPHIVYLPGQKLWRSKDDGVTWSAVTAPYSFTLGINPANPLEIYLGSGDSVYRSADEGGSWTLATSGNNGSMPQKILASSTSGTVLLGTASRGFMRTTSGGQ